MYLSLMIISRPMLAANNRGENSGNAQTLQKVSTRNDRRTVLSGISIRRAMRVHMQKNGASMWRETLDDMNTEFPAGYVYRKGDTSSNDMNAVVPESPSDFDDTIAFGYMVAPKGSEKGANRHRSQVSVSDALSTTPWDGDTAFAQGLKAGGELNPFSFERHYTRYQFTVNMNLTGLAERPQALPYIIQSLKGLQVGGNHAGHASDVIPEFIVWRFHKEPGTGGLYLAGGLDFEPNKPIDPTGIVVNLKSLGLTDYQMAGTGQEMSISQALEVIETDAVALLKEG